MTVAVDILDHAAEVAANVPSGLDLAVAGYAGEIGGVEEIARDPLTFLPKPYTTEQLAARVRALLDQPPARPA